MSQRDVSQADIPDGAEDAFDGGDVFKETARLFNVHFQNVRDDVVVFPPVSPGCRKAISPMSGAGYR